jgi:hypothetical protein
MRLTGDGIWGPPKDRKGALAVLRRAVELDVNFIDAADSSRCPRLAYGRPRGTKQEAPAAKSPPPSMTVENNHYESKASPDKIDAKPLHWYPTPEVSVQEERSVQVTLLRSEA